MPSLTRMMLVNDVMLTTITPTSMMGRTGVVYSKTKTGLLNVFFVYAINRKVFAPYSYILGGLLPVNGGIIDWTKCINENKSPDPEK